MTFTVTKYDSVGQRTSPCQQRLNNHLDTLLHEVVDLGLRVFHAYHVLELVVQQVHAVGQLYSVPLLKNYLLTLMIKPRSNLDTDPHLV